MKIRDDQNAPQYTSITIRDLTFDGNRPGTPACGSFIEAAPARPFEPLPLAHLGMIVSRN